MRGTLACSRESSATSCIPSWCGRTTAQMRACMHASMPCPCTLLTGTACCPWTSTPHGRYPSLVGQQGLLSKFLQELMCAMCVCGHQCVFVCLQTPCTLCVTAGMCAGGAAWLVFEMLISLGSPGPALNDGNVTQFGAVPLCQRVGPAACAAMRQLAASAMAAAAAAGRNDSWLCAVQRVACLGGSHL